MYSSPKLQKELPHLVNALREHVRGQITDCNAVQTKFLGNDATYIYLDFNQEIYGPSRLSAMITNKGYVYNPVFMPQQLSVVFDWLNRFEYDKERQQDRTNKFKQELIEKCGSMTTMMLI
jgi:hypothetical protein